MPPKAPPAKGKGKKKKKTKEELEEERRQAEEAARLAEEERLRAEEAERQRLAELERQRLELLGQYLTVERARLEAEHAELDPLLRQFEHERVRSRTAAAEAADWDRFLRCVAVPAPRQRVAMAEALARLAEGAKEAESRELDEAFATCEECRTMLLECRQALLVARHGGAGSNSSTAEAAAARAAAAAAEAAALDAAAAAAAAAAASEPDPKAAAAAAEAKAKAEAEAKAKAEAAAAAEARSEAGDDAADGAATTAGSEAGDKVPLPSLSANPSTMTVGGAGAPPLSALASQVSVLGPPPTTEWAAALEGDLRALHGVIATRLDRLTAVVLHHCDEYANDKNEIQLGTTAGSFKWGVWVNTAKNPRLKVVEMPQLGVTLDIPKQIALANVALRVQHRSGPGSDETFTRCANHWMAVGGVLSVDLLALPPGAKKVRGWTLRQVTPLASNVQRVPYPIPPAGADPLTWQSEEEPPPLGVTAPLPPEVVLLQDPLQVGWWDEARSIWNTDGISDVSYDSSTNTFSFHTTHLAPLALVMSRTRLLPYKAWTVRPTGGRNGASAAITLECPSLDAQVIIEVGTSTATLTSPVWPQLQSLLGVPMAPLELLQALSDRGLHLLPEDRDAGAAGLVAKDWGAEEAMCRDLALLGGTFLMASSRWNQTAGPDECLARVSEVTDWEEGGRTLPHHALRIFEKEKEDGERRVLVVMRRGPKGVAFSDALDRREAYPALPGVGSVEAVQATAESIFGEIHSSVLSLLRGHFAAPGASESPLALRLACLPETLELARTTSPLFTATLADTMLALRLFSFS
ncbi:hypothetical protein HYH03_014576 [Edaphochlamys debaryana]|uniref:IC97/Casc1 N-terminal domain-containing protein n=1 Tax=Edaphochlamys debaryana TaxID=47281 RepID=A0A836BS49_9CHLO|nr:hypothetical protein HYH03_014576 [Edaphochlamys debaryana]|eukprot:KAG2486777.1 hypothetical protein HYH03_014576 [Edaphochlamys debaryana]